jgi:hypothetical protein
MPTELAPGERAGPRSAGERSVWSLSRDDQRLLWITFLAGLASLIVAAATIGAAIAVARWVWRAPGLGLGTLALFTALTLTQFVFAYLAFRHRHRGVQPWLPDSPTVRVFWVLASLALVLELLAWIGVAAAIK